MRHLALLVLLPAVAALAVGGAVAQTTGEPTVQTYEGISKTHVKVVGVRVAATPRPIQLPNVKQLVNRLWRADRTTLRPQLVASQNVIRFWNHRGRWIRATRHQKCWEVPWQRSCRIARASYRLHLALAATAKVRMFREIPVTSDWRTAVRLTQRVFPGTESWLLFISHREGGYGGFVMNHQGSGAGGWMQFMASTFYGYVGDAKAAFERKGFIVDPSVWQWTNPLGQALTAGYMRYTGRDGCHWCL